MNDATPGEAQQSAPSRLARLKVPLGLALLRFRHRAA